MKNTPLPTREEIEALTAYLAKLYADGFSPVQEWRGGEQENGTIQLPYPLYEPLVEEFIRQASTECWRDYGYEPGKAGEMLRDENFIKTASLEQIKTMLTYCVRGERFGDGHWGAMIEQGYIRRLLERLNEIKEDTQD